MASSRPIAFVLVPGASSSPTIYNNTSNILISLGYTVSLTRLLSASKDTTVPAATMTEDAAYIHSNIVDLFDKGFDVILAMNSYGGVPGTEASKGLSKAERQKEGKEGSLLGLVYLASFVIKPGTSLLDAMGGGLPESMGGDSPYMTLSSEPDAANIFNDLPIDQQIPKFEEVMVSQSRVSLTGVLSYPGYHYIPATFVVAGEDRIVPPTLQHSMVDEANKDGAGIRKVVLEGSSHAPMVSRAQEVVDVLLQAAGIEKIPA